ncbi:GNAT family N-acetyltransferase [Vreelandella rituensis]|uniref:GNAT family N-acetyltransferase n=1 Tax=Vreelandella rituensis TaxID=2282306 RepID=A0A368TWC2_9GAMM|nr:GNAT family N-acetyltransferase [Halomonas rituensis]RCV87403.1 GNAT family N-acetyltransferase [Halomonas rituensis]
MSPALTLQEGDWASLGEAAGAIRRCVFIVEQQVPQEEEWDGLDPHCRHFLAYRGRQALGTARLLPDGHIGRVAVLAKARGQGVGRDLMEAAIACAQRHGHRRVVLSAQTHALAFYESLGFVSQGEEFLDAGIPHLEMVRPLTG